MKTMEQLFQSAGILVNRLTHRIDEGILDFIEAEREVVQFVNTIGHLLVSEVVEGLREPCTENTMWVGAENRKAVYKKTAPLRFINRFGHEVTRNRRCYQVEGERGQYSPLDERLGLDKCGGYSPLMSFLLSLFGGSEPYAQGERKIGEVCGFLVSATAVQKNTERTGMRLEHHPLKAIPAKKQSEGCELMIVEVDGTMSPQIHQEEGICGREGLKQPTEYKECNVISIEKRFLSGERDRWVGAQYGERKFFEPYAGHCGIKMGQLSAKEVVFIADGARHNWEIQATNYPGSIGILDFYHVLEHLSEFCELFRNSQTGKQAYAKWRSMLYEGGILQVLVEMKHACETKVTDRHEAIGHVNYFQKNKNKMQYDQYREKGYPIGSGLVEGNCKLVVNRRFKANGMRWKRADNEAVLEVRLAILNDTLPNYFKPKPRKFSLVSGF
jgi:hypothetical protein